MTQLSFLRISSIVAILILIQSCKHDQQSHVLFRDKTTDPARYDLIYQAGNWDHPDYKNPFLSFGNHRIVVEVNDPDGGPVQVKVPWRRRDKNPESKAVIVVDASSGEIITRKKVLNQTNEQLWLSFYPEEKNKLYYIYYLPHSSTGGYYPKLAYLSPGDKTLDDAGSSFELQEDQIVTLPHAQIISAQSIDAFHSFFPMEIKANQEEVETMLVRHPQPYYLFPEYREYPIKMEDFLPLRWAGDGPLPNGLKDTTPAGSFFTFQIGIWSPARPLSKISLYFSEFKGKRTSIDPDHLNCFNLEGIDHTGHPFSKPLTIPRNKVQALWCGMDVPADISPGDYRGFVVVSPEDMAADTIFIELEITAPDSMQSSDDKPQNMNRLKWLNSTIGSDSSFIAPPFIPLEIKDKTIGLLGREIELNPLGFPSGISSFFKPEMTGLKESAEAILAAPIGMEIIDASGMPIMWSPAEYAIEQTVPAIASWNASASHEKIRMNVKGRLEYDGMLDYEIQLIARQDQQVENISLSIPMMKQAAEYMLGLGYKGCKRPENIAWTWDVANNHQEGAWLGTVNKGLQYVLRDDNYERPLNTNFYRQKPLKTPASWYNEGKGGIRISTGTTYVNIENFSGSREIRKGDTLNFNVRFLITPFKAIDTKTHFNTRFVHKYVPIDSVVAWNGTVVNVHHANEINPYINYPFYNLIAQMAYLDKAHEKGIKVKLYNTIRELTYKAYELFALKSLGDEILNDGRGGGHSWLQEHLDSNYHAAWHATAVNDAAILNKGNSRWTNYYIEGINWLAKNQQIDGLYLDDIAFDRSTMKRLSNVLYRNRDEVVIDLHSANQFNERDGYINSAFLYMEHMPYISRLWFGEYFEYDLGPDYWLTEVSGIPFGLTGEMLEGGGHPYRGMLYGMTSRIYGDIDMRPMWKLFDKFGIAESEMLGYWVDRSPVKTDVDGIKCSVFLKGKKALIVLASWSPDQKEVPLQINWDKLGWDKGSVRLYSPAIKNLQAYKPFDTEEPIPVERQQGIILVLEQRP